MKKIQLTLLLLLSFCVSFSQIYQQENLFGREANRFLLKYSLGIPRDTVAPAYAYQTWPHLATKGDTLYLWSTSLLKWTAIRADTSGGGGGTPTVYDEGFGLKLASTTFSVDTSKISTPYDLDSLRIAITGAGSWSKLSDSVVHWGRDGAELVYLTNNSSPSAFDQDSLILLGGWHRDSIPPSTKHVYKYNRTMDTWRRLPDAPWSTGLHCFGVHYQNDSIYVWGGDAENPATQQFWVFKVSTEAWTLLRNNIVSTRSNYGTIWDNGPLMIGGIHFSLDTTNHYATVMRGYQDGSAWTTVTSSAYQFKGVFSGAGAKFNNYLYMIGGVRNFGVDENARWYSDSIWRSSDNGATWEYRGKVPFNSTGYYGKGRAFMKVVPSFNGEHLGLFFGYQRVATLGIVDFYDSYVMDKNENWKPLAFFPGTGKNGARHAPAVAPVPDGWIIATGYGTIMRMDAWKMTYPYNGLLSNEGNRFGYPIRVGARDSNNVHIIMQDTARVSIYKDSIAMYAARFNFNDNGEPLSLDRTTVRWMSNSAGVIHRYRVNSDSGYLRFAQTQGGEVGGWRITGAGNIPALNLFNTGRARIGFNGMNTDYSGSFFTVTAASSTGGILALQNGAGANVFSWSGDGGMIMHATPGTSAGSYDLLTRNTANGLLEKIPSSSVLTQSALNDTAAAIRADMGSGGGGTPAVAHELKFKIGVTVGSPAHGDSLFSLSTYAGMKINFYREGELQFDSSSEDGYEYDFSSGDFVVHPPFRAGERVIIQAFPIAQWTYDGFPSGYDADADTYFAALATAGVSLTTPEKEAYNDWVIAEKAAGRYSKYTAIYPFMGGTAAAHAINAKSPGTNNITFSAGWTHTANGIQGNGTTATGSTGVLAASLGLNSIHLSLYINQDANGYDFGVYGNSYSNLNIAGYGGNNIYTNNNNTGDQATAVSDLLGMIVNTRTISTEYYVVKNGTSSTKTATSGVANPFDAITIGGVPGAAAYSAKRYAFATIGSGLTVLEAQGLTTNTLTLQTTLGRN